jgi:hypothetical protein
VIEQYGMRSRRGRAGVYLVGYGRMFTLAGRQLWRRAFRVDQLDDEEFPHLDPFRVAKEPDLYKSQMAVVLDAVARQFAQDLNPPDRRDAPPPARARERDEQEAQQEGRPGKYQRDELAPGELPDPDDPL